jgi:hypothetical protein
MTSRIPIFLDYETYRIAPGMPAPKLVCGAATDREDKTRLMAREEATDFIERVIEDDVLANHWVFFDLGVAVEERPSLLPKVFRALDENRVICTKIVQMMADNAQGQLKFIWDEEKGEYKKQNYALFRLIQRHLGYDVAHKKKVTEENADKLWRLNFHKLDGLPVSEYPTDAAEYAMGDPVDTKRVWQKQAELIGDDDIPGFQSQMQAAWALNLLGTWGMRTDPVAVREYKAELQQQYAKQISICQEYGFRRGGEKASRNMAVIREAVEKWYRDSDLDMKLTEKGAIATDREQLTDTDHPGLHAVAKSVKTEKLLTTYIAALERGSVVPLNPNYNPIIETFRTSCSGGMKIDKIPVGFNAQNLPRGGKVRGCFIPCDGYVFCFFDFDTLEVRAQGQVCLDLFGHSEMARLANEGLDFHASMAADTLGHSYGDVMNWLKGGNKEIKNARQHAKITTYGCMGGMGARTLVKYAKGYGIDIELQHARWLRNAFFAKYPEMNPYLYYCSQLCQGGNAPVVVSPQTGMMRGDVTYTATANFHFQHLAAMGAKRALYQTVKECYVDAGSPLFGCRPMYFGHDEIGMEIPYDAIGPQKAHEAAMRLGEVMVEEMRHWIPDVAIGVSGAMFRRWHKDAEAVYQDGIMVPCRPSEDGKRWVADL